MRYLLTPSLHNSYKWYLKGEDADKASFLDTLNKKGFVQTEAMMNGITFENNVRAVAEGKEQQGEDRWMACVNEVAQIVKGGLWQQAVKLPIQACGMDFLLYGKMDVWKRDTIYDIKFTGSYEIGKFRDSVQHGLYMVCTGIRKFKYLITDGRNVYQEDYYGEQDTLNNLIGEMAGMVNFIMADPDFKEAYQRNWQTYPDKKAA